MNGRTLASAALIASMASSDPSLTLRSSSSVSISRAAADALKHARLWLGDGGRGRRIALTLTLIPRWGSRSRPWCVTAVVCAFPSYRRVVPRDPITISTTKKKNFEHRTPHPPTRHRRPSPYCRTILSVRVHLLHFIFPIFDVKSGGLGSDKQTSLPFRLPGRQSLRSFFDLGFGSSGGGALARSRIFSLTTLPATVTAAPVTSVAMNFVIRPAFCFCFCFNFPRDSLRAFSSITGAGAL